MHLPVLKVPMCLLTKCHVYPASLVTTVPLTSLMHPYYAPMGHTRTTLANWPAFSVLLAKVAYLSLVPRLIVKMALTANLAWLNVFLAQVVTGREIVVHS